MVYKAKARKVSVGKKMLKEQVMESKETLKAGRVKGKKAVKSNMKAALKFTKTGQPYMIDPKTGRARFVKKK